MATPKTDRPRGRPRKHPEKPKGPPGRPPISLRDDPHRYAVVYLAARKVLDPAIEPTSLAREIANIHGCEIGSREEAEAFAAALLEGRAIDLKAKPGTKKGRDDRDAERWRDRGWANAGGEALWRKTRAYEEKLRDPSDAAAATDEQKDAYWMSMMLTAWLIVLGYYRMTGDDPLDDARRCAAEVGEAEYFDRIMEPYFLNFPARFFAI